MPKRGGRPTFKPTKAQRDQVILLRASGMAEQGIADALGIHRTTLRERFADELATGHAKKTAELLSQLAKAAKGGNVAAMRTLLSRVDTTPERMEPKEPKPEPLGKKEQATLDAQTAHEETGWSELLN